MGKFLCGLFLEGRNGVVVDLICIFTISYISRSLCYTLPYFGNIRFMHRCLDRSYMYNHLRLREISSNANDMRVSS
jgi:hypothetical protein